MCVHTYTHTDIHLYILYFLRNYLSPSENHQFPHYNISSYFIQNNVWIVSQLKEKEKRQWATLWSVGNLRPPLHPQGQEVLQLPKKYSVPPLSSTLPLKVTSALRTLGMSSWIQKGIIYCLSYEGMQFCRDPTAMVAGPQGLCLSCTCALWARPPCSTWVTSVLPSAAGTTLALLPLALECLCITQMPAFHFSTCCDAEVVGKHCSRHTSTRHFWGPQSSTMVASHTPIWGTDHRSGDIFYLRWPHACWKEHSPSNKTEPTSSLGFALRWCTTMTKS